jgi:hypothetical protein
LNIAGKRVPAIHNSMTSDQATSTAAGANIGFSMKNDPPS